MRKRRLRGKKQPSHILPGREWFSHDPNPAQARPPHHTISPARMHRAFVKTRTSLLPPWGLFIIYFQVPVAFRWFWLQPSIRNALRHNPQNRYIYKGKSEFPETYFSYYVLLFCVPCYSSIWYYFIFKNWHPPGLMWRLENHQPGKRESALNLSSSTAQVWPVPPLGFPGPRLPQHQPLPLGPQSQEAGLQSPW